MPANVQEGGEELTGDISGEGGGNFDGIRQPVLSRRCFDGGVCPLFGLVITISFNRVFGNLQSSPASILVDSSRL